MIDILIAHGDVFTMTGDGVRYVEDGAVGLDRSRITTIEEEELLESVQRVTEEVNERASCEVEKRKTFQHRMTTEGKY